MAAVQEIRMGQRTNGPATILAIGTANPPNETYQVDFPDHYFRITNSQHLTDLKAKFKSMCAKSMIKKRHLHVTEEIVKENPYLIDYTASSLEARQALLYNEVPKLGKEASEKAIKEWGQPKSRITHVVFGTNIYMDTPGADHHLVHLLGLKPSVKRFILRQGGCHAGGTVLRIAKDMAENNPGARVLVVCVEMSSAVSFHAPNTTNLLPNTIFGDGAGALIVGADPDEHTERSIFQLVLTEQTTIPDSTWAIHIRLREMGLVGDIIREIPELISKNIENILRDSFKQIGLNNDWNSIFWVVHPGGPVILDQVEAELGLETRKLEASRHVLSEFGNMLGASVVFVLDEMRSRSLKEGKATTGEGFDWGVLLGFGPGVTIESIVLRSAPIIN